MPCKTMNPKVVKLFSFLLTFSLSDFFFQNLYYIILMFKLIDFIS